jgi:hypothetical protein
MSQVVDPALEKTPASVVAMKSFKEKLMQGHKVKATQFGIELPGINEDESFSEYSSDEQQDYTDNEMDVVPDEVIEQDPDAMGPMEETRAHKERSTLKKDPVQMLAEYLESTQAKEDVKIIGPFGKLGFKAVNVSITEFGVAFIIKKDAIQFEPNINTELTINYRGQDYSVIYAGGFFTFPKIPFTFVSFLRVSN